MNKFQKSLDRIKKNVPLHEDGWTDEDKEHIVTIMEALEKQIAKKPIKYDLSYSGYKCPTCDSNLYQLRSHNIYKTPNCIFCGQALDWSDTE